MGEKNITIPLRKNEVKKVLEYMLDLVRKRKIPKKDLQTDGTDNPEFNKDGGITINPQT